MQSARGLEWIFKSAFNKDVCLQFWVSLLSLSFFQLVLLLLVFKNWWVCLSNSDLKFDITGVLRSSYKTLQNSFERPLLPGYFLFGILFKAGRRPFSDSINLQCLDWSSVNCGIETKFRNCIISFLDTLSENKFS